MKRITEIRQSKNEQELIDNQPIAFKFNRSEKSGLEYFPASIIEKTDGDGNTHNDLRVFHEAIHRPDVAINQDSILCKMRDKKVKMLY